MNWQEVYDAYPINAQRTWLNNCGITPTGRHIAARMAQHFEGMCQLGPGEGDGSPMKLARSIKQHLGDLLHAHDDEIALVHNTAEGMTMISLGLELSPGDEILLLENEYPSNVYPWEHWRDRGVKLTFVPLADTQDELLHVFEGTLTPRTKVVAISLVHWCTGMPLPIREIAALCHERGILCVVDGSQGVGNVKFDFAEIAPAIVCFSAWKWLLGPLGLGVLIVDRTLLSKLRMPFKATDSVADPNSYLPYQNEMRKSVDRYTYSTANYNDWVYFDASLDFLSTIGYGRVHGRILELTARLWNGLWELGFRSAYRHGQQPESGILSVHKPDLDIEALCAGLNQRGIVSRVRLNHLRLAPHVYLSPEQLDATVRAIADLSKI
ncbi:MAG TPA: aminotransferase class V-fold PLP-dependent enzyme [Polyangiaceae bacterium]|nr:aminotransferase class V-fold PLP-dependent enzyme [Polyangiaceae bacterium]